MATHTRGFDGVQDVSVNVFFSPLVTTYLPQQPPQLTNIVVKVSNVLLGGIRSDKLHCSWFHHKSHSIEGFYLPWQMVW